MRRILLLATALAGTACSPHPPVSTEIRTEALSPDGRQKVVLFTRDAGATTSANTHASLLPKAESLSPSPSGNLFIIDHADATVFWTTNDRLLVVFEPGVRVFKKESPVGGVTVEYREK